MDPLNLVEAALKSGRSVVLWGFGYGRQLRDAWAEGKAGDPGADYYASRLGAAEDGGEALEPLVRQPGMGCSGGPLEDIFRSGGQTFQTGPAPKLATTHGGKCRCGHWLHPGNLCAACGCNNVRLAAPVGAPTPNPPTVEVSAETPDPAPSIVGIPTDALVVVLTDIAAAHGGTAVDMETLSCVCGTEIQGCDYPITAHQYHVARIQARAVNVLMERAAADRRIDEQLQASGFRKTTEIFEQHRKAQK